MVVLTSLLMVLLMIASMLQHHFSLVTWLHSCLLVVLCSYCDPHHVFQLSGSLISSVSAVLGSCHRILQSQPHFWPLWGPKPISCSVLFPTLPPGDPTPPVLLAGDSLFLASTPSGPAVPYSPPSGHAIPALSSGSSAVPDLTFHSLGVPDLPPMIT